MTHYPAMRYLAWVAVFSLQMGMFVCGAGIDVCHAADEPAHIEATQSNTNSNVGPVDSTCAAHAAHVFLALPVYDQNQSDNYTTLVNASLPLNFFDVHYLIEHPPKLLHS